VNPNRGDRPAKKLVLVVIDALKPAMLERAIATGRAPALARIREEGVYVDDCVAAFRRSPRSARRRSQRAWAPTAT
jgi:predicted AlkP superfamily pyrophosphatase or phosphodiesterase